MNRVHRKIGIGELRDELVRERVTLKQHLLAKFDSEDWHSVQDAASDLRDIDASLSAIYYSTLKTKADAPKE